MTSKLVVNTIEADTGISSVSFASSISLSSTSVFHLGDAGVNIGADTNISRAGNGILAFNINSSEKVRINSAGKVGINSTSPTYALEVDGGTQNTVIALRSTDAQAAISFLDNTSGGYGRATIGGEGDEVYFTSGAGVERLRIQSDGDISFSNSATGAAQIKNVSGNQASVNGGGFPQYGFVGNEGTGMRRVSANTLAFDTNGNEQLRIDNIGDCLLLGGTLRIKDSGNSAQRGSIYGDASAFYINAGGNLKLYSGGGERVVFDNNGASTFKAKVNVDYTVSGSDYVAYFRNQNANCYGILIQQPGSANAGYPLLACSNGSGGSHFRVDSGGNVYANSGTGTEKIAYFCRAWASISQTGTQTKRDSKGISSISDQGVGYTRINLTNAQPHKNYSISVTGTAGNTSAGYAVLDTIGFGGVSANEPATTYFSIRGCQNSGSAGYDHPWITVAVFG